MDRFSTRSVWCSNTSPTRICAKSQALYLLQQQLHFRFRADCDAHEPRTEVLGALAQQNSFAFQALKQSGAACPKIGKQKIPRAWESLDAQIAQFSLKPRSDAPNFAHIPSDSPPVADRRSRRDGRIKTQGEGRHAPPKIGQRRGAGDACAEPQS